MKASIKVTIDALIKEIDFFDGMPKSVNNVCLNKMPANEIISLLLVCLPVVCELKYANWVPLGRQSKNSKLKMKFFSERTQFLNV